VTADVPWPSIGGARTRNAHLLEALADAHDVVVAALHWGGAVGRPPAGIALHTVPWTLPLDHQALEEGRPGAWESMTAPAAEAMSVSYFDVPAMESLVARLCAEHRPDVAVLTETPIARFRSGLPPDTPVVLDLHDVQTVKQARRGDPDQAERLRRFESAAARDAAVTVCVSDSEAQVARDLLNVGRVAVVPNGVDTARFVPAAGPGDDRRIVFTGSLHTQENVEAIVWFVREVLPLVRLQLPDLCLDVVGSTPADAVRELAGPAVAVYADVPDTRPYLEHAGVVVIPLLHGGGTRLKALEAAATRRAVVTTTVGIEGLPLQHGRDVEVADDAPAFARAVVHLCRHPAVREERAAAALSVAAAYDWERIGRVWRDVVESVA